MKVASHSSPHTMRKEGQVASSCQYGTVKRHRGSSCTVKSHRGEPTHTRDTQDTRAQTGNTDHTDEPHNHPNPTTHKSTIKDSCWSTGKKTPEGAGTPCGTHTGHTGAHTGTRITQTNLTTIQTHQPTAVGRGPHATPWRDMPAQGTKGGHWHSPCHGRCRDGPYRRGPCRRCPCHPCPTGTGKS